ncbi:MAG: outer spore coat protein CotE [Bacillota bacterium]
MLEYGELEGRLREIITRTALAKGKRRFTVTSEFKAEREPVSILGVLVTNHSFTAAPGGDEVEVKGQMDLHVWYSFDQGRQSAINRKTVSYTELIPVHELGDGRLGRNEEIRASLVKEPQVADALVLAGSAIEVVVTMEFAVEIIGEARLVVKVYSMPEKKEIDCLDDDADFDDDDLFDDIEEDDHSETEPEDQ